MYDQIAKSSSIQFVVSGGIKDFDNIKKVAEKGYYACIRKSLLWKENWFKGDNTMLTKRIIPCLDIKDGKVVKGINFVGLKDVGDPIELC